MPPKSVLTEPTPSKNLEAPFPHGVGKVSTTTALLPYN